MKARHVQWAKLSWRAKPRDTIRLLDLPGMRRLEDMELVQSKLRSASRHDLDQEIDEISRRHFGITASDTEFEFPDDYWSWPEESSKRWRVDEQWSAHDAKYETRGMPVDEAATFLKSWGWDITDERGHPLLVAGAFVRQLEAVARGYLGHMPDLEAIKTDSWAQRLAAEAQKFQRARKSTGR